MPTKEQRAEVWGAAEALYTDKAFQRRNVVRATYRALDELDLAISATPTGTAREALTTANILLLLLLAHDILNKREGAEAQYNDLSAKLNGGGEPDRYYMNDVIHDLEDMSKASSVDVRDQYISAVALLKRHNLDPA
jgi:hypothetical protein